MKFGNSQRELNPANQFTPPCNYYDPHRISSNKNVLTGTLAGPSVIKEQACFGLEKRFKSHTTYAPGPGSYANPAKQQDKKAALAEHRLKIRSTRQQAFIGSESNSPSIPYHQFNLDEEEVEYARQLLMNEDLNKSSLSIKRKTDGYTFSKSPKTAKQPLTNPKSEENPLESITEYSLQKQSKRNRGQMIEQVKRSNQRRQEIMNLVNPEFVPSLELIEIITKRRTKYNPGPGAYNYPENRKQTEPGAAFTTSKRFAEDERIQLGPGEYKLPQERKTSAIFSKSARNLFNMKSDIDLEHRFYIDPLKAIKLNESAAAKLKANHAFGSQVMRFTRQEKEQPLPQESQKMKRISRLQEVVEKRLKKLQTHQKKHTCESEGLLGISTMASTID